MRERTLKVFSRIPAASIFVALFLAAVPPMARAWQQEQDFTQSPLVDGQKSVVEVRNGISMPMTDVVKQYHRFVAGSKKVEAESIASTAAELLDYCCLSFATPLSNLNKSPSHWVLLNYRVFVVSVRPLAMVLVPHKFHLETNADAPYQADANYTDLISPMSHGSYGKAPYLAVGLLHVEGHRSQVSTLVNRLEFTNLIPAVSDSLFVSADSNRPVPLEQALQSSKLSLQAIKRTIDGKEFLEFQ